MAIAQPSLPDTLMPAAPGRRSGGGDSARRIQRLVGAFRLLVALGLLAVALMDQEPPLLAARRPELFAAVALAYAVYAALVLFRLARDDSGQQRLVAVNLAVDIIVVTVLMHAGGGISSGIGGLLVVLVGAASLNLKSEHALLAAAVSALAVLGEQALAFTQGLAPVNAFIPAGVLGAIILTIAAAASPLARRLQESEALALQRGIDLANLAQLNDYVIQNLRESIVVVDAADQIRLINQSAAELLGMADRRPGQPLRDTAAGLYQILRNWRRGQAGPDSTLGFPSSAAGTRINTYFAPLEGRPDGPVLMFLEDASLLAEKVRQTKLLALGRLSASIAHEIRNPVGALSHAAQLLQEAPGVGAQEQRLLDIINVNSRRVSEIVENVLQLSRRDNFHPVMIELGQWAADFVREFSSTLELPEGQVRLTTPAEHLEVRMDPGHLHQVCWNLCDNAIRYASEAAGGISVEIAFGRLPTNRRPYLEVADRGPGIHGEMRERLFEPFATGRAGGTGLGLFISRELCEYNRAALSYEAREGGGGLFRVVFADPARWSTRT